MKLADYKGYTIVVGYDETAVRLFDRRHLDRPVLTFYPLDSRPSAYHATHVAFNQLGSEVVVNQGCGGGVFVFSVDADDEPRVMERLSRVLEESGEPIISSKSLPHAEIREIGSNAIREKHFSKAIDFYSDLISRRDPDRAFRSVCHSNRATALLLRRQRGDTYACIRDCVKALEIHRGNSKALFRLIKSFATMEQVDLAKRAIEKFKTWFPGDASVNKIETEVNL
uniref:Uncharacterized protein n=1 Tax=Caenorhabditis japonica TaxID=281687 RepID=A0A8R1DHA5_CAEJA